MNEKQSNEVKSIYQAAKEHLTGYFRKFSRTEQEELGASANFLYQQKAWKEMWAEAERHYHHILKTEDMDKETVKSTNAKLRVIEDVREIFARMYAGHRAHEIIRENEQKIPAKS